ncbi:hypothetical protein JZL99_24915 [Escherichia coli]|uniref:hypothetical protein n=1 Tax=Escherichia coli TaxID=562 RepID=UPI0019CF8229|nr:hypothetical protein [Escherichia coli]MBN6417290.1 hypothetical protein [Escherichia coli]
MKKKQPSYHVGENLLEVSLFIILLTGILVSWIDWKKRQTENNEYQLIVKDLQEISDSFSRYLISTPCDSHGICKINEFYVIGEKKELMIDSALKHCDMTLLEKTTHIDGKNFNSGLITFKNCPAFFSDERLKRISGALGDMGGTINDGILHGNYGAWILNPSDWGEEGELYVYLSSRKLDWLKASRGDIHNVTGDVVLPEIKNTSISLCSFKECNKFDHVNDSVFTWTPMFKSDLLYLNIQKTSHATYYVVEIEYLNNPSMNKEIITSESVIAITPQRYEGEIKLKITPSSLSQKGNNIVIHIVQHSPEHIAINNLWDTISLQIKQTANTNMLSDKKCSMYNKGLSTAENGEIDLKFTSLLYSENRLLWDLTLIPREIGSNGMIVFHNTLEQRFVSDLYLSNNNSPFYYCLADNDDVNDAFIVYDVLINDKNVGNFKVRFSINKHEMISAGVVYE